MLILLGSLLIQSYSFAQDKSEGKPLLSGKGITTSNGMVVSAHHEGSKIGAEILEKGGNAVDAAVATGFALAVCYPEAGNIGGGGFMVIRTSDGKTNVIDYREKAPQRASRNMFLDSAGKVTDAMSTSTLFASGVPGSVDGLISVHTKYGRLPFREVIQPAIDLAEKGFTISERQAATLNTNRANFISRNDSGTPFVKDSLWKGGDLLIQHDLAETLKRIRDHGRDGFYSGETAALIIKEMQRGKGIISVSDLNDYRSVFRNPVSTMYRGYRIITVPPPSSGGIILTQLLRMVEPFNINEMGFHSVNTIHLVVECEKRAFADRAEYLGDPDFMKISPEKLIRAKYLRNRMSSFNSEKASFSTDIKPGNPDGIESEETTHYSVVDASGNAVSVTTTLNGGFGSSIIVNGAGFILNNQMDDFSLKPGFPNMYGLVGGEANSIQPGKRMLSSMTPVIVEKNNNLFMVAGSPGGSTIPTTVFQVIINVIDFGMDIQSAVDAGRFHHQWLPDYISIEKNAFDSLAINHLEIMGHAFSERPVIGSVNAILILRDGKRAGGADSRAENSSCGY